MNNIQKVSDITANDIAEYLRLAEPTASDIAYITTLITVAKDYMLNYTGLEDLDAHSDLVIVVFILCQDMFDTRAMYVDNSNVNKVVETVLGMHQQNLL